MSEIQRSTDEGKEEEDDDDDFLRSRLSSPSLGLLSPTAEKKGPPVPIPPPVLRPQHVYPPVAPLGMLSLGVLSKYKDEGGGGLKHSGGRGTTRAAAAAAAATASWAAGVRERAGEFGEMLGGTMTTRP